MSISAPEQRKTFSIIIASYNCGAKIEKTLRSIFSNDENLFELIIMDGASTDDTLTYVEKYKDRLTLISEPDEGVYHAFNKAIDRATGEYIYFIGTGDCLRPAILTQIINFLPHGKPAFVYGKCHFIKQNIINGREFTDARFVRDNLCQQGIFYHRDIFDIVGKFDQRYKIFADWFFNLRCFMNEVIEKRFVDLIIADYEEGGISSELDNDPVFIKEFPHFVKENFGTARYFMCRAFLKNPYVFNYIFYGETRLLWQHMLYKSAFSRKLAPKIKSYRQRYGNLKKNLKSNPKK